LTLAPDWICEVLSPSTEYIDRSKKPRIYAREGVGHAWLVDTLRQTLEVLALESGSLEQIEEHHGSARPRASVRCRRARATSALELTPRSVIGAMRSFPC
jgi:Uma2 family endonuclease